MLEAVQSAWHAFWSFPHLKLYLVAAWLLYLVPLCFWIVLQKREPAATISWVMSLAMLPYLGFLIYFLFGPQKIKRQRLRRLLSREGVKAYRSAVEPDDGASELGVLAKAVSGLPPSLSNRVELLVDGAATFDAIVQAVAAARNHVHLEYYIYSPDRVGTRLRDALVERAAAGVKVRVLLDAVGSSSVDDAFMQPLLDAGGEFAWFHPTRFQPFTRSWVNLRSHRKIVVVDGQVGFTGGINVTEEQDEGLRDDAYVDLHMRLEGEVVRGIQLVFLEDWAYATRHGRDQFEGTTLWRDQKDDIPDGVSAQVLVSGPDSSWEAIHRMHVAAIHEAKSRVWLVTPYFVPGEAAMMALTSAALGGLDVRVVVPRMSDSRLVTYAARSYYTELLEAGIKIHEYGPRMMHTKALLCDDGVSIIGSANFDHRSFRLNFEISILLRDRRIAGELEQLVTGYFDSARLVQAERERPLWRSRTPEAFARLLSPLL